MSLTLIAVANRGDAIELTYEETVGDPQPFVLTVTSRHISSRTSKRLPITASDLEAYVEGYATALKREAEKCKAMGLGAAVCCPSSPFASPGHDERPLELGPASSGSSTVGV